MQKSQNLIVSYEKTALFCAYLDNRNLFRSEKNIAILDRCAKYLHNQPSRKVHIVAPARIKNDYFRQKLLSMGVDQNQIQMEPYAASLAGPKGIWVLVARS